MKSTLKYWIAFLFAVGCYVFGLAVFSSSAGGYTFTLICMALFSAAVWAALPAASTPECLERRLQGNLNRAGLSAAFYYGFLAFGAAEASKSTLVLSTASMAICVVVAMPGLGLSAKRLVTVLACTLLTYLLQPPLESLGVAMDWLINLGSWAFAEPGRDLVSTLCILFVVGVVLVPVHHHPVFVAKTLVWLSAVSVGVYFLLVRDVLNPSSSASWVHLLIGWVPVLFSGMLGFGGICFVDSEFKRVNFDVGVRLFVGVVLFAVLQEHVPSTWFANAVAVGVFVFSTAAAAGSRHYNRLVTQGAANDGAFYGMLAAVVGAIMCLVIYNTLFAAYRPLFMMVATTLCTIYGIVWVNSSVEHKHQPVKTV